MKWKWYIGTLEPKTVDALLKSKINEFYSGPDFEDRAFAIGQDPDPDNRRRFASFKPNERWLLRELQNRLCDNRKALLKAERKLGLRTHSNFRAAPGSRLLKYLEKVKGLYGVFGKEGSEHLDLLGADLKRDRRLMLARRYKPWKIRVLLYFGFLRSLGPILLRSVLGALAIGELIRKVRGK